MRTREEIPSEYKWAIEDLYENDERWREDYEWLKSDIPGFACYRGRLGEGADVLLAMQRSYDELNKLVEKVYVYANQRLHENTDNGVYQNLASLSQSLLVELSEACAWIEPELLALPDGTIEAYLQEKPELSVYRQYFENIIRQKEHVLPKEQEALLASLGGVAESPKDIFSMFNNADLRFPPACGADGESVEVTHGNFITLMQSGDRELRRSAFRSLYSTYASWRNTLAATYRANVKQEVFFAKARKYGSDLEGSLDGSASPGSVG
ncbi:MAG: oligoendopeptidase F, partial [Lachnospiraceae bacterium]|nr:oligoendopeptidase F [Lachnospiraceae bacterium]